ncbi:unnamed protein product [Parnassius mnemosyne]|uniref:Alpha 1,4-glycosyltransferase domain-containing protein n=1 Tax=Parnassius mnemosyne TaxID=213953 RepID=A0AAV1LR91_9NEOP
MLLQKGIVTTRRRIIITGLILFLVLYMYVSWSGPAEDISCHYLETNDALPSADDYSFSPPDKSIFFHETSCRANLTSRQSCAIESAARAHRDFQIHVLFSSPVSEAALDELSLKQLTIFDNIRFSRIHIVKYAEGTPVADLVNSGALNNTQWKISHTSDVLRFLTLYKWGGIYLDLDVVVAKPLDYLTKNWAARESDTAVATGALAFSRDKIGRRIAAATIREIQTNFRGDDWGHNGPGVITRVLKKMCTTSNVSLMSAAYCGGFQVYQPELFYPIEWQQGKEYFEAGELKNRGAFVYHVWNHLTKAHKVHKNSPYAQLARRFCPLTYDLYGDLFGT